MADPDLVRVGVVVLNFRQPDLTALILHDLSHVDGVRLSVLVIDNGSGDDSAKQLAVAVVSAEQAERGHHFALLALQDNLGFAGGTKAHRVWLASVADQAV